MCARSRLATRWRPRPDGSGTTCVSTLHAEAPLLLKMTRQKEPEPWAVTGAARVSLTAGAAGPIGGDDYRLAVEVGTGSTLVLSDISATLLLPGPDGAPSFYTVTVDVGEDATLIWLAEPLIAARGCNHRHDISVALHPSARLLMREELLLGRHGEACGTVRHRITVRRGGFPQHRQDLAVGPGATGYDSAAVLGGARAVGSVLIVDPGLAQAPTPECARSPDTAVLPLAGPAVLVTAVADDNLALRRTLHAAFPRVGGTSRLRGSVSPPDTPG